MYPSCCAGAASSSGPPPSVSIAAAAAAVVGLGLGIVRGLRLCSTVAGRWLLGRCWDTRSTRVPRWTEGWSGCSVGRSLIPRCSPHGNAAVVLCEQQRKPQLATARQWKPTHTDTQNGGGGGGGRIPRWQRVGIGTGTHWRSNCWAPVFFLYVGECQEDSTQCKRMQPKYR